MCQLTEKLKRKRATSIPLGEPNPSRLQKLHDELLD